jgi:hypothetical protein
MADILLDQQGPPASPSAGQSVVYVDSYSFDLKTKDSLGFVRGFQSNFSLGAQSPAAATRTYLDGSAIEIPVSKLQIGTSFRWDFNITKTAAGIAASTFDVCVGVLGTTGDAARLSFTKPAGTAVVDQGTVSINVLCRGPISATGVIVGQFTMVHNLAATGHAIIPCVCVNTVSAAFDLTVAQLIFGVCLTSGAADAITIQQLQALAWNL